jgi:hypothetical protein
MEKDWKVAEVLVMVLYAQPRIRKMPVDREWEVNTESYLPVFRKRNNTLLHILQNIKAKTEILNINTVFS